MAAVMAYTKREAKTLWRGQSLVSGINCRPESVYDDFLSTKLLYHKDDKTLFFHMVQSFPKGADVDPVTAHAAALELGKYFEGREVLVCTHTDRGHVHSHFIINSVSLEDGRKLHISEPELAELRQRNDQVCEMFCLPVFQKGQKKKKVKSMSTAEYHAAARGESWKFRLMDTIDECMRYAGTREEFITLMRTEGYDVRWEASRRNITYTLPGGMKCRDDRLHDERYLKEAMEREFRIRAGIVHGGIEAAESSTEFTGTANADASTAGAASDAGGVDRTDEYAGLTGALRGRAGSDCAGAFAEAEDIPDPGADHGAGAGCGGGSGDDATGWEAERAAHLSPAATSAHSTSQPGVAANPGDLTGALGNVAQLGHALERTQDDVPVKDATTTNPYTDRKVRSKERRKKIAQGHAPDDHEDEQKWQQTM
ncbi:MAG: relaxase/mobilization nuclease domain-containing protein [Oscillospiraceae bacterium]|nr:relaxase/mobilization nuclease domain-containing protein [Oscillospiraceae bacterium]